MSDIIVDTVVKYHLLVINRRTKEPIQELEISGPAPLYPQYHHICIDGITYIVKNVSTDISNNALSGITHYITRVVVDVSDFN